MQGAKSLAPCILHKETIMETLAVLLSGMSHSTIQGFLGVTGIVVFLGIIVVTAAYRIKEQMDQDGH